MPETWRPQGHAAERRGQVVVGPADTRAQDSGKKYRFFFGWPPVGRRRTAPYEGLCEARKTLRQRARTAAIPRVPSGVSGPPRPPSCRALPRCSGRAVRFPCMKLWFKRITVAVAALLALLVALVAGVSLHAGHAYLREWDVPLPDTRAVDDPAIIARGEYLVHGPAHCADCHAPDSAKARMFAGEIV